MTTTPIFGIPELSQSQANPDITHNEALVMLQTLLHGVLDKDLTTPPVSPSEGDSYIIGDGSPAASGAWSGRANSIAVYWGGSWRFVPGNDDSGTPITMGADHAGIRMFVVDEDKLYTFSGSPLAWNEYISPASLANGDYGDVTVSGGGTTITIDNDVVSDGKLRNSTGLSVIGRSANSTGDPADIVAANDGEVVRRSGATVGFGTVATAGIADNAITDGKLRDSAAVSVIGRSANSTGDPADIAAGANDRMLRRVANVLDFGQLTAGMVPSNTIALAGLANATGVALIAASGAGAWAERIISSDVSAMLGSANNAAIRSNINAAALTGGNTGFTGQQYITNTSSGLLLDANVVVECSSAGAFGAYTNMYHNSASPAVNDFLGGFRVLGKDSGGNLTSYASFHTICDDPTNGSEDGRMIIAGFVGGVESNIIFFANGTYAPTATGGAQGLGTANFTAVYDDGVILCAPLNPQMKQEDWDALCPPRIVGDEVYEEYQTESGVILPAVYETALVDTGKTLPPVVVKRLVETGETLPAVFEERERFTGRVIAAKTEIQVSRDPESGTVIPTVVELEPARLETETYQVEIEPERPELVEYEFEVLPERPELVEQQVLVLPERPEIVTKRRKVGDAPTEPRTHRTARRHFDMIASGFNPNDAGSYVDRLRKDGALPGMLTIDEWRDRMIADGVKDKVSVGERTERLQLAVDYLACALANAVDRLKQLEGGQPSKPVDTVAKRG